MTTLTELIEALKAATGDNEMRPCVLRLHDENGEPRADYVVEEVTSWRGSYEQVTMNRKRVVDGNVDMVVGDLIDMLEDVIGTEVTGYKGGQYYVYPHTRVWADPWGTCPGDEPVDVVTEEDLVVVNVHPRGY